MEIFHIIDIMLSLQMGAGQGVENSFLWIEASSSSSSSSIPFFIKSLIKVSLS